MLEDKLTLTFDCGTQSVRSILFDQKGCLLHISKYAFPNPYYSHYSGWAEQDATYWWYSLAESAKKLKREISETLFDKIESVSVTSMRDTYIPLDEHFMPLRASILWLDQRTAKCEEKLKFFPELAFRLVGMRKAVQETRRASVSNWLIENEKENWSKMRYWASLAAWFNYMLTGSLVDSIGNQVGHIPFNYKEKRWLRPNELKFGISPVPPEKLVPLVPSGTVIGVVNKKGSQFTGLKEGVKVVATGTDKGCETLGSGCITDKMAALSFGTTSTVQLSTKKYVEPQKYLPSYPAIIPDRYNPEVEIFRGYWMITWFIREFGANAVEEARIKGVSVEEVLNQSIEKIPPGFEGLLLQPYWGPGLKIPEAKGSIIGFSDYHTKDHVYKAIIEGINYGLMDGLDNVSKNAKTEVKAIVANGGGARSKEICQLTSDMFGLPLSVCQTTETSGLGSAIASFVGTGHFSGYEEAVSQMVHYKYTLQPNERNQKLYSRLYKEYYLPLYSQLRPLYKTVRKIIEEN